MTDTKDGGPAFPGNEKNSDGTHYHSNVGMSLRDWFAGQALAGLLGRYGFSEHPDVIVTSCRQYADAMLSARGSHE